MVQTFEMKRMNPIFGPNQSLMRFLTVCVLLLGLPMTILAQPGLKIGIFGVPHFSYLLNADDASLSEDAYRIENLPLMSGGISLGLGIGNYFGLRFSPTYAQQGGAFSALTGVTQRSRFTERLDYVKLPLMIGLNTNPQNRKFIFSFYFGASANVLTRALSFNDNPLLAIQPPSAVLTIPEPIDRFADLTWSIMGETGFDIQLPPENFSLNLRLRGDYTLTDVEDKETLVRIQEGGRVVSLPYWNYARGSGTRNADTFGLNVGLLVGVTYNFR
jgi:hypothetical protein